MTTLHRTTTRAVVFLGAIALLIAETAPRIKFT